MQKQSGIYLLPINGGWIVQMPQIESNLIPMGMTEESIKKMGSLMSEGMTQDQLLAKLAEQAQQQQPQEIIYNIEHARDTTWFYFKSFLEVLAFLQKSVKEGEE